MKAPRKHLCLDCNGTNVRKETSVKPTRTILVLAVSAFSLSATAYAGTLSAGCASCDDNAQAVDTVNQMNSTMSNAGSPPSAMNPGGATPIRDTRDAGNSAEQYNFQQSVNPALSRAMQSSVNQGGTGQSTGGSKVQP